MQKGPGSIHSISTLKGSKVAGDVKDLRLMKPDKLLPMKGNNINPRAHDWMNAEGTTV